MGYLRSTGQVALVDVDAAVDQNKYTASAALTFDLSGRPLVIRGVRIVVGESGDGAVIKSVGDLLFFSADPAIVTNDAAITAAEWLTVVAHITFAAAAYGSGDANGASAHINTEVYVPIVGSSNRLWVTLFKTDAAVLNNAAGDDEFLWIEVFYET